MLVLGFRVSGFLDLGFIYALLLLLAHSMFRETLHHRPSESRVEGPELGLGFKLRVRVSVKVGV